MATGWTFGPSAKGPSIWCLRPMWVPTLMEPQRVSWDERQPCRESVCFSFWDNPTPKERRQTIFFQPVCEELYRFIVCWCVGVGVFFSMDLFFVDGSCWGDQRCCLGPSIWLVASWGYLRPETAQASVSWRLQGRDSRWDMVYHLYLRLTKH